MTTKKTPGVSHSDLRSGIMLVNEFHRKFEVPVTGDERYMPDAETREYRINFLREELAEFEEAIDDQDPVKAFDALLDLAYVVYGTALMMGIDQFQWVKGFSHVHSRNMAKVRATSPDQSKRGTALDVVKPEGWYPPEEMLKQILFGSDS